MRLVRQIKLRHRNDRPPHTFQLPPLPRIATPLIPVRSMMVTVIFNTNEQFRVSQVERHRRTVAKRGVRHDVINDEPFQTIRIQAQTQLRLFRRITAGFHQAQRIVALVAVPNRGLFQKIPQSLLRRPSMPDHRLPQLGQRVGLQTPGHQRPRRFRSKYRNAIPRVAHMLRKQAAPDMRLNGSKTSSTASLIRNSHAHNGIAIRIPIGRRTRFRDFNTKECDSGLMRHRSVQIALILQRAAGTPNPLLPLAQGLRRKWLVIVLSVHITTVERCLTIAPVEPGVVVGGCDFGVSLWITFSQQGDCGQLRGFRGILF